jgi:hypothetical protein
MSLDFSSADYRPGSRKDQISKCRAMAEEAMMLSCLDSPDLRDRFLLLARSWSEFADQLERA